MVRTLPGTTIEVSEERWDQAPGVLDSLFLAGGLTLSQVAQLTGLEPYVIQNWVKRGFLAPPKNRRYTQRQFCRVALINMLRGVLQLDAITGLLSYLNGSLVLESDDIIGDDELYRCVLRMIPPTERDPLAGREVWDSWCREALGRYTGPYPGAERRVAQGLRVILTAYAAGRLKREADGLWRQIQEGSDLK